MAMTPMIIIGCGGSGGKVIASLRQTLKVQLQHLGWEEGIPEAWQLIYVDTPAAQEVDLTYGPAVPAADYVSLSQGIAVYANVDAAVMNAAGHENLERFIGWRPSPQVPIPVTKGAGQWRSVGRMAAFNGLPAVARRFERALSATRGGATSQLERLGALLGDEAPAAPEPLVVIVSSLAGGTGAGIFLDVADVIKTSHPSLRSSVMGVLFTAEVFKNLSTVPGVQPNTLAALSEMMSAYFDLARESEPAYKGTVPFGVAGTGGKTGINYPFIVGSSTVSGHQIERIPDVYRSVTETLGALMMRPGVNADFNQYVAANWPVRGNPHTTSWSFGNVTQAHNLAVESGVVDSFGSARLSVGSLRFSEYASHRLARSVIEYLADGYIEYGRGLMNDPQATPQQIIEYFVVSDGMSFIEACGLRELNDAIEHNQVLDGMIDSARLDDIWRDWHTRLYAELQASTARAQQPGNWMRQIQNLVPLRQQSFLGTVADELAAGEVRLAETLPEQLLAEVSARLAQYGVPITLELVRHAAQHVRDAIQELRREAANERQRGSKWQQILGEVLQRLPVKADIPPGHQGIQEAVRQACSGGYREARSQARQQTADFLQRYLDQVLSRVESQLVQIQGQLAGPDARQEVASWPGKQGIPAMFAPPPLEFCLIDPEQWPHTYDQLLRETAGDEPGLRTNAEEVARRAVGGGGFRVEKQGRPEVEPPALRLAEPWTNAPITLQVSLDVDAVHDRARIWLNRTGTVFGDFLKQRLGSYLSGTSNGQAVADLQARLDRFKDGLQQTLARATPLVDIDPVVLQRVHPRSRMKAGSMSSLIADRLPLPDGRARDIAEIELAPYVNEGRTFDDYIGDGTFDVESVLYVSFLRSPVHPAAIASLSKPIASTWNQVRTNRDAVALFWENRRARRLDDFIPVAPHTLDLMIKGWTVGRLLGRISDPDPESGFKIAHLDSELGSVAYAEFPWPLLRWGRVAYLANKSFLRDWLPALLESLGLAFALFESQPELVRGYDELYKLGDSPALEDWILYGQTGPQAGTQQLRNLPDVVSRRDEAIEKLRAFRKPYEAISQQTKVVSRPDEFFAIHYGYELYERIQEQIDHLIATASSIDGDVGIVG